jgi:hypothetical protein
MLFKHLSNVLSRSPAKPTHSIHRKYDIITSFGFLHTYIIWRIWKYSIYSFTGDSLFSKKVSKFATGICKMSKIWRKWRTSRLVNASDLTLFPSEETFPSLLWTGWSEGRIQVGGSSQVPIRAWHIAQRGIPPHVKLEMIFTVFMRRKTQPKN